MHPGTPKKSIDVETKRGGEKPIASQMVNGVPSKSIGGERKNNVGKQIDDDKTVDGVR